VIIGIVFSVRVVAGVEERAFATQYIPQSCLAVLRSMATGAADLGAQLIGARV